MNIGSNMNTIILDDIQARQLVDGFVESGTRTSNSRESYGANSHSAFNHWSLMTLVTVPQQKELDELLISAWSLSFSLVCLTALVEVVGVFTATFSFYVHVHLFARSTLITMLNICTSNIIKHY